MHARIRRLAAFSLALVLAVLAAPAQPAAAAGETIQVVLSQTDGTPSWDGDDLAGHDTGGHNQIVRTNDNITYNVQVNANGGSATNTTITLVLPKGVQFDTLPAFCAGSGSALSPATMPAPVNPVTATSWQSLQVQTLTCNVGPVPSGSTLSWDLVARVRPELPNGTTIPGFSASVTSDTVTTPAVSAPVEDLTVSARALYDVSKNSTALTDDTGYFYSSMTKCHNTTGYCRSLEFPLLISGPDGGKGISPLTGAVTLVDDVSPAALYGTGVLTNPNYLAKGAAAAAYYGGSLVNCTDLSWQQPYRKLGMTSATVDNAVRDSGTTTCTQPGGPGTPINIKISGMDSTAYTYPTAPGAPAGAVLPAGPAYVYSYAVVIEVPIHAAVDLGTTSNSTSTLPMKNTYTDFTATDLSGQANAGDLPGDNYRTTNIVSTNTGSFNKWFAGLPNATGNTPPSEFAPGWAVWEGPAGSSGTDSGDGQLFSGGTTISALRFDNTSTSGATMTHLGCDAWDNSLLHLTNINVPGSTSANMQMLPANGAPVWVSGVNSPGTGAWATSAAQVNAAIPGIRFQYGTGVGGAGSKSTCADADSPDGWFDDPALVPGNDATLVGQGEYTAVSRVRILFPEPYLAGNTYATVSIGLKAVSGLASGTILPNWATDYVTAGALDLPTVLAHYAPTKSTYVPATNAGNTGDRLTVASAVGRLKKEVWSKATSGWVTSVPQYAGGQTVDYRLSPTLTSGILAEVTRDVVLEDCLPAGENFQSASVTPSTVAAISGAMPAGAGLTCSVGQTYVKWDLGQKTVNQAITPVTYTVKLSPTINPGTYTNTARVTVEDDASPASLRTKTAAVQVVQPTGVIVDKVALTPIVEVNRAGEANPDPLQWRIDMANLNSPVAASDIDIIDVLPQNGVNATAYTGSLKFVSASVTAGSTSSQPVTVLYTKAATVNNDANDASNGTAGIAWCDAAGHLVSGSGACPAADLSDATGLRIKRPGSFGSGSLVSVVVTMLPSGNAAGDIYDNQAAGRAVGLQLIVGPIDAKETVIASSIGNYVWMDANGNGIQDTGEAAVPNFPVTLSGKDTDGNAVSLSTTTGPDGKYLFSGLQSGDYVVTFDPAGLAAVGAQAYFTPKQNAGTDVAKDSDGDPTTGKTATITLPGNFNNLSIDQGITTASIGIVKQVCSKGSGCDQAKDADWSEDAAVFPGDDVQWRIKVTNTGGVDLTNVSVADAPVTPACDKTIGDLAAQAVYTYTCTAPTTSAIKPNTATATGTAPNGKTVTAADTANVAVFTGSLGDTVWYDANGNKLQDAGEPGIQNATVTVTVKDPNTGQTRTFTTTTDDSGHWSVTGLPAGTYTVTVSGLDPDFVPTYDLDGTSTASTTQVTLTDGQSRTDVDFGYRASFTLGNEVWIDTNGNGVQDSGEPPVPDGTVVQLWNATTNAYVKQTTVKDGLYSFTGLPAGDYYVVIPSAALNGTLSGAVAAPNGGSDPNNDIDNPKDHNAIQGTNGAIQSGIITLSATLSPTAGAQLAGDEPSGSGFTNNTLDLALLGAPSIQVDKEVCDSSKGACVLDAALGADGWVESYQAHFLDTVTWRITVKNTGLQTLSNVAVTDALVASCAKSTSGTLAPGASSSYTCTTTGLLAGFTNTASVSGTGPTGTKVTDSDTASVVTPQPNPGIKVVKFVDTAGKSSDANGAPGVYATAGSTATFTYKVSLPTGVNVPLKDVSVTDDNGTAGDSSDDWAATYQSGDSNSNGLLDVGETWIFASTGHDLTVPAGQYSNVATALGTPVTPGNATSLAAQDPANVYGVDAAVKVTKFTNDQDANTVSGPGVVVGDTVTWTYLVVNTGNVPLINVSVADSDPKVTVSCGAADANHDGTIDFLDVGVAHQVTCTAKGKAKAGQYENVATVAGTPADAKGNVLKDASGTALPGTPKATDPSHYFGVEPGLSLVKTTQTIDSDAATGPFVKIGDPVVWTYTVKNTGTTALANVIVTDDLVDSSKIACAPGTTNVVALLLPGASATCTASGVATAGQYANTGKASGAPMLPPPGTDLASPDTWPTDPSVYSELTKTDGSTVPNVTDENPDHYFGISADATLTKYVNGQDANAKPGPLLSEGDAVTWTYQVVNTGTTALLNATVTDDKIAAAKIDCGDGSNVIAVLLPGAANAVTCKATGKAIAGQYTNVGTVVGTPAIPTPASGVKPSDPKTWPTDPAKYTQAQVTAPDGTTSTLPEVTKTDPANYFGAAPKLAIVKTTQTVDSNTGTGPLVQVGAPVTWTYTVTNSGNTAMTNTTVTDDKLTDSAAQITCVPGTKNVIALLLPGGVATCTASGVATAGQYSNTGTSTGTPMLPPTGTDLTDPSTWPTDPSTYSPIVTPKGPLPPVTTTDPDHYLGVSSGVALTKYVNGEDANTAFGVNVTPGSPVTWTYKVTNTGTTALTGVTVTDDKVAAASIDCGSGGNTIDVLLPGKSVTCKATGVAIAGQYTNIGTVTGTPAMPTPGAGVDLTDPKTWPATSAGYGPATVTGPDGTTSTLPSLTTTDPANYYGATSSLTIVKKTNDTDNNTGTGPFVVKGGAVTWTYTVTNTGNTAYVALAVTDDKVPASSIDCGSGTNVVALLLPGASTTCRATGVAVVGQYSNTGTATGQPSLPSTGVGIDPTDPKTWPTDPSAYGPVTEGGKPVPPTTVTDPDHYFGADPGIAIVKEVCKLKAGCDVDRDKGWVKFTLLDVGSTATFRITVTNTGNVTLAPVTVSDPQAPACNTTLDSLAPGASSHYACAVKNVRKGFKNVATATGQPVTPDGVEIPGTVESTDDASVDVGDTTLPYTGFEALPIVGAGGALALLGLGLVLIGKRRRERETNV